MKFHRSLFAAALLVLASNVWAQGASSYVINHFVSDNKVITPYLVITDVEGKGPNVLIKFYDSDGNIMADAKEKVPPFGKLNLDAGKLVQNRKFNGSIQIDAEGGNIVAEYWQFYKNNDESWKNTTTIGQPGNGYSKLVVPHFVAAGEVESYIVLTNPGSGTATASLSFYDDAGKQLGSASETVPGNGKKILEPGKLLKGKFNGVCYISVSGGRLTGDYWQAEAKKKYQIAVPLAGN